MKVVLFCGGLGTRIREYSEAVPKPMVPIGSQPILWHIMQYYSHYGHHDFVLCLGYKAGVIKDYFLNYRKTVAADCVVSNFGDKIEILGDGPPDWRVALIDTGIWRNIGGRLMAVKPLVESEEVFLANYSDGLTDAPLPEMVDRFRKSGKLGCFMAVRPPFSFHLAEFEGEDVKRFRSSQESKIWINGGYFIFRSEIFEFMRPGEELVLEPFNRLLEKDLLMAYKHEGFWRAMDTLRDRQVLEEMIERGDTPWRPSVDSCRRSSARQSAEQARRNDPQRAVALGGINLLP
jgi:glucose-1-phosphate cytidylyltransferase